MFACPPDALGNSMMRTKTFPTRRVAALLLCFLSFASLSVGAILPTGSTPPADAPPATVEAALAAGLFASSEVIDLTAFSLPAAELSAIYTRVLYDEPGLFHVAPRLAYRYTEGEVGRVVTMVYPAYTLAGEELAAARAMYADAVSSLAAEARAALGLVENTPSSALTPAEEASAALYLHDRLAARYDYDTRASEEANRDAYRLFRDGVGVCQAYALAYLALCRAVGLEADFVSSAAMDHAWNHVRVGEAWYHVDVTRDDPLTADGESAGVVDHSRFLRSDAGMAALGYHDYACPSGHVCESAAYEEALCPATDDKPVENSPAADTAGEFWGTLHRSPMVVLRAGGSFSWVGVTDEGILTAYRAEASLTALSPGDIDGDGAITPGDLLALTSGGTSPATDACLARLRAILVGHTSHGSA